MKKAKMLLVLAALLTTVTSCTTSSLTSDDDTTKDTTTTTEEETTKDTTTTTEEDTTTTTDEEDENYDKISSLFDKADDTQVTIKATVTADNGSQLFVQDNTGSFTCYYGKNGNQGINVGDLCEFSGKISSFGGNKQIASGFSVKKLGTGSTNCITVNTLSDLKDNLYAPIKASVTMKELDEFTSKDNDTFGKVLLDGKEATIFIKKRLECNEDIYNILSQIGLNSTFTIEGAISGAYEGNPQIMFTDVNQIILKEPETMDEKLDYAKSQLANIYALNNTTISSNLTLPTKFNYGVTVKYISNKPSYLTNSGVVTRPSEGESNESVTLTIEIYIDGVKKDSKNINLTIKAKVASGDIELDGNAKVYYKNIDFTKNKEALKTDLYALTSTTHSKKSYDYLWTTYKDSDTKPNGQPYDIYSNYNWPTHSWPTSGNYKDEGDMLNREHGVPQSWFGKASPMVSDAFHIYPSDGKANGARSNYLFGEVRPGTESYTSSNNSRRGNNEFKGYNGTVFELSDEYKGDMARSYFYMATRYQDKAGGWGNHFSNNNFTKLSSYSIDLFTKWAEEDPVSQREIDRNNGIYKHQRNRNPFIDVPGLDLIIFGDR